MCRAQLAAENLLGPRIRGAARQPHTEPTQTTGCWSAARPGSRLGGAAFVDAVKVLRCLGCVFHAAFVREPGGTLAKL